MANAMAIAAVYVFMRWVRALLILVVISAVLAVFLLLCFELDKSALRAKQQVEQVLAAIAFSATVLITLLTSFSEFGGAADELACVHPVGLREFVLLC